MIAIGFLMKKIMIIDMLLFHSYSQLQIVDSGYNKMTD